MKNLYKQVKTLILRNKVSDFEYDCVKTEIYQTNLLMLEVCSLVGCVLFFVLGIVGIFFNSFPNTRTISYFAVFAVMLFIFISSIKISQEKLKLAVPLLYVFIWTLSVFTAFRGIYGNTGNYSVMFVVLEFAIPVIFIDRVLRMFRNTGLLVFLNMICTILFKDVKIARVDIFYMWLFYGLSFIPCFYLTKIRVREFFLRQIIENQRDTDELTGLSNKAAFIRLAKKNINSTNTGILIMLDLDYFKQINDTYGHFVGDKVLKKVAVCIQEVFRSSDVLGRFGGDEFLIFMVGANQKNIARMRCEQLLELLNKTPVLTDDPEKSGFIQASIGFAVFEDTDFDTLFKNADAALYEAKNSGKNKVCCFENN